MGGGRIIVGIGVDVVDIGRLRAVLDRHGERFIRRVYTAGEREYCRSHDDPAPYYAARFAAKEAVFKALGTGWDRGVTWRDAEIRREGRRPPVLHLTGEAEERSRTLGTRAVHVSLSHSEQSAVALVILEN